MLTIDSAEVRRAAELLLSLGAKQVFVFGSAARGTMHPDSDIDLAVSGLPARLYLTAVSETSDVFGRPVDLVDLDDLTPRVRHLLASGELVRVG
jgi:predicted nucleotidyltransferase